LPANLPHPMPNENLKLFRLYVEATYSLLKYPVPAKSSNPNAKFGKLIFLGLYINFTLNPLSKKCPGTLSTSHKSSLGL